jgi:hypothetical protein
MKKWLGRVAGALCIIVIFGFVAIFLGFQASLPIIEGSVVSPALIDCMSSDLFGRLSLYNKRVFCSIC